jgi:PKD repeat protein
VGLLCALLAFGLPGKAAAARPLPIPQPFSGAAAPHLTYYGGPVMTFTENAVVLWGAAGHSTTLTTNLPGFIAAFANAGNANPYNVVLEYRTPSQPVTLASRYLGSFTITPSTAATRLSDDQVAAELVSQIGSGALPPPRTAFGGPVTEYYVMFPPSDTICIGRSCSGVDFCAYHSNAVYAGTPFTYAILPESTPPDRGCGANSSGGGLGNLTSMASHEMVESMTDPEVGSATDYAPPLAWYDAVNGEVADICDGQDSTLTLGSGSWVVQKEWSNAENACIASHAAGGLKGVLASFATSPAAAPVGFDASATTTPNSGAAITSYAWNWGDGSSSSGSSPAATHAYAEPGTRRVTMVATDSAGASGAQFLSVTTRSLSVSAANGNVTSTPAGINCTGSCTANFLDGATVSLTASPAAGRAFAGWTGDCSGQGATCVVTMNAARTVAATFTATAPTPAIPAAPASVACVVPKVTGRTVLAAQAALKAAHCSLGRRDFVYSKSVAKGRIVSQSPLPGTRRGSGSPVKVVVSKGRPVTRVTVCYRGRTIRVTRATAKRLRAVGATLGPCRTARRR